jgi:hypothetical protein
MKPATIAGFIFYKVGTTGQVSNLFIRDLIALQALMSKIGH